MLRPCQVSTISHCSFLLPEEPRRLVYKQLKQRSMTTLLAINRVIMIGRARSRVEKIANQITEKQLNDIGQTKCNLIEKSVANIIRELEESEKKRNNRAIRYPKKPGLWVAYKCFHLEIPIQPSKADSQSVYLKDIQIAA